MNKLKPTTEELDNEDINLDESCQILTQKKKKLNNALTVLSNLIEQLQTEEDSDELDFYEEYQKLYFDVQKGIWAEIDDPLESHILIHFVSTYIDHM
ncbi:hypothetical protein Shal_1760 [Shewanella halifaxensis HAW-EB4]|uniref:Uncharacterized protein n=1 Tax=Shewanella halifaxensis (strain HAW-EB4) TaxID=458817 RepID=B0TQT0_SHEHH|nr:hypothetical protein [Shewanella halifaxensis]ABZ76325.1 hypothetical protein Shal_1760 [Shewanella halifaxensis HAW-EB4]